MRGFIKVQVNRVDQFIAVDQIRDFTAVDRYRPNENARITLIDGTVITTDWTNSVTTVSTGHHRGPTVTAQRPIIGTQQEMT